MLHEILPRVNKPGRYLGCEVHSVHKNKESVKLRVALAFPDVYEVAFSHLGLKIIYHTLNNRKDIWAERVYSPWGDMEQELRQAEIPLFALESKDPICDFDLLGFTLQHELCATNILAILELGGIPLRSKDRNDGDPIVIAGGPNASNPEPFADFFDAFVLGDGEEAVIRVADVLIEAKEQGRSRQDVIETLSKMDGVYVPSVFHVDMDQDGNINSVKCDLDGVERIRRNTVSDLNELDYIKMPLIPTLEPVHDRFAVEIQRGCSRGCRFCQAGMIYRPTRQRSPEKIMELARDGLKNSGQDTLGLLSLSASDYNCLAPMATELFKEHQKNHVSIQLPSLRVEGLNEELINVLNQERKTGFTLAPEAATERLRRVINKGNTEEDLLNNLKVVFANGWQHVKLYFMIGLPTETYEDVEAIIDLAKKVKYLGRGYFKGIRITVSVSTFVPKAHTPFQWCTMMSSEDISRKQGILRDGLRRAKIAFKYHDKRSSLLETALARGDRRLSAVIETVYKKGARFDSWTEQFDLDKWIESFEENGIDFEKYINRTFDTEQILPWSHLDYLLDEEFLKQEYKNSLAEAKRLDCAYDKCTNCGVCDHKTVKRHVYALEDSEEETAKHVLHASVPKVRESATTGLPSIRVIRFQYEKQEYSIFLGHLDVMSQVARAFRRAGITMKYSEGFHPKPKIGFSSALPLGVSSRVEFFDAELLDQTPVQIMISKLNENMPVGMRVVDAREISKQTPSLSKSISSNLFEFDLSAVADKLEIDRLIEEYEKDEERIVTRTSKRREKRLNIKEYLQDLNYVGNARVSVRIVMRDNGSLKPSEFLKGVFKIDLDDYYKIKIEKTGVAFAAPGTNKKKTFRNKNLMKKERAYGSKIDSERHSAGNKSGVDEGRNDR